MASLKKYSRLLDKDLQSAQKHHHLLTDVFISDSEKDKIKMCRKPCWPPYMCTCVQINEGSSFGQNVSLHTPGSSSVSDT